MKTITIIGNLGANAVRRMASDGRELMTFNVAVSAGKDSTTWFNCVGSLREKVFDYLVKGQCVAVIGDLTVSTYNGRADLTISIDRVELCGRAPQQNDDHSQAVAAANQEPLNTNSMPL